MSRMSGSASCFKCGLVTTKTYDYQILPSRWFGFRSSTTTVTLCNYCYLEIGNIVLQWERQFMQAQAKKFVDLFENFIKSGK